MEQESRESAFSVTDMSDLVVVDLESAADIDQPENPPNLLDVTQGL